MTDDTPFWQRKSLDEMTRAEWESLCDGCGLCCLIKFEDIDTGELIYSNIVCRHFDDQTSLCQCYSERSRKVPDCWTLTPENIHQITWLPETCAYRLLRDGEPLAWWHPLVSGDPDTVHAAGIGIRHNCVSEEHVHVDDWQTFFDEMTAEEEEDAPDQPDTSTGRA